MPRESLDASISQIEAELMLMAGMVENAIATAVDVMQTRNETDARRIVKLDDLIDAKELEIETYALETIRRETPLATDLRRIFSATSISGELERIGDYAGGIARITLKDLSKQPRIEIPEALSQMARIGIHMLQSSLHIYIGNDHPTAESCKAATEEIAGEDEKVDRLYNESLIKVMRIMGSDNSLVQEGTYILWMAHNLERIADRAVNVAERAYFQATGEQIAL